MSFMMIFLAMGIAITLLIFFMLASKSQSSFPENMNALIDWSAIQDSELQSYLPNQKISAIKRYRELTGVGLKEAKDAIEYILINPDAKRSKRAIAPDTGGAGVRDLLLEGRVDEAIDVYAAFMGIDEYTARSAIEVMQRELEAESHLSDESFDTIRDLMAQGNKIEAIKQYRLLTGTGLAEAKRAVEEME